MQEADLRVYLKESLFMSFNRYENDRMLTIVKRASQATADKAEGRGQKAKGRLQGREQRTGGNGRSGKARSKAKGRTARGNKRRRRA
jgi:hypothetical protein